MHQYIVSRPHDRAVDGVARLQATGIIVATHADQSATATPENGKLGIPGSTATSGHGDRRNNTGYERVPYARCRDRSAASGQSIDGGIYGSASSRTARNTGNRNSIGASIVSRRARRRCSSSNRHCTWARARRRWPGVDEDVVGVARHNRNRQIFRGSRAGDTAQTSTAASGATVVNSDHRPGLAVVCHVHATAEICGVNEQCLLPTIVR